MSKWMKLLRLWARLAFMDVWLTHAVTQGPHVHRRAHTWPYTQLSLSWKS
jgi:hypothetical protein